MGKDHVVPVKMLGELLVNPAKHCERGKRPRHKDACHQNGGNIFKFGVFVVGQHQNKQRKHINHRNRSDRQGNAALCKGGRIVVIHRHQRRKHQTDAHHGFVFELYAFFDFIGCNARQKCEGDGQNRCVAQHDNANRNQRGNHTDNNSFYHRKNASISLNALPKKMQITPRRTADCAFQIRAVRR